MEDGVTIALPYRPPFDWDMVLAWLGPRAIPGVERVDGDVYRRTIALEGRHGVVAVRPAIGAHHLELTIRFPDPGAAGRIAARVGRTLSLDADMDAIDARLGADPLLRPLVAARPGLRVPGAWDPFDLAVRAILGQQITVAAATTLAGRVAAVYGEALALDPAPEGLTHVFPAPAALIDADPGRLRIPRARAATIAGLARAMVDDDEMLVGSAPLSQTIERLCRLPGIGPWTANYIAMRGLRHVDAFPAGDLGLRKAAAVDGVMPSAQELEAMSQAWRPWRAYAAMHLWHGLSGAKGG